MRSGQERLFDTAAEIRVWPDWKRYMVHKTYWLACRTSWFESGHCPSKCLRRALYIRVYYPEHVELGSPVGLHKVVDFRIDTDNLFTCKASFRY